MRARTGQPGGDRGLPVAEDALGSRWVQPSESRRQHHGDLLGRCFQPVQGDVMSRTEGGVASLTTERLDPFGLAMLAIPDQGMNLSLGDAVVRALRVGTSIALGVNPLGGASAAFHLAPGTHSSRRWLSTRRGGCGETTGGAIFWGSWLEQTREPAA